MLKFYHICSPSARLLALKEKRPKGKTRPSKTGGVAFSVWRKKEVNMLKPLPAGRSTFRTIIRDGLLYVDKTKWIYEMVHHPGGVYFLSRPRRFGKSLMVSTLEEIFFGNQELFEGLWIYESDYQWQKHPVIRIDFSEEQVENAATLQLVISDYLSEIAASYGLTLPEGRYLKQFRHLIRQLANHGQVVILIDEYDHPIIDHITDVEEAIKIRDTLKGFYNVIKANDQYLRFVFLTGVSKFSQVGVFSGLNNLTDITMTPAFSDALGITSDELLTYFPDYITRLAQQERLSNEALLASIKKWYNGFCFSRRCQQVYNPYSLLRLFQDNLFSSYWFATGTPSFLIKLIKEREYKVEQISDLSVGESAFTTYEIEDLAIIPLLFQTGYLTIKGYDRESGLYQLYYPNYEVQHSFLKFILRSFSQVQNGTTETYLWRLKQALKKKDFELFFSILEVFFAGIPYDLQLDYEKYYQTIFYLIIKLVGLRASAEERTNKGRIDTVVELEDTFIIFEFKLNGSAQEALEQIKDTEYAQKYRLEGKEVILVGVNFSTKTRQVSEWKVEKEGSDANQEAKSEQKQVAPAQQVAPAPAQQENTAPIIYNAIQIARNFLAQGVDVGVVAQSTGLPIEAVQELARQVNR